MEASQVDVSNEIEDGAVSVGPDDPLIKEPATVGPANPSSVTCSEVMVASFENKKQSNLGGGLHLQSSSMYPGTNCELTEQLPTSSPGVSNCYVFKSRLQEYAQRVGLPTPVYETIKEGPSHEPSFRSTVIVNGARYDSLLGFFNRKAAEQSAAEVALMELSKSGDQTDSIAMPVHETGLCKNLLQEYAQKMNYAIPTYICRKEDTHGRTPLFSCAVDIGGTKYIGAAVKTKKEAEIKAARTALLAIWSSGTAGDHTSDRNPQYTVVPGKRKVAETAPPQVKIAKVKKPKRSHFKKKSAKQSKPCNEAGMMGVLTSNDAGPPTAIQQSVKYSSDVQLPNQGQNPDCLTSSDQNSWPLKSIQHNGETLLVKGSSGPQVGGVEPMESQMDASSCQLDGETSHVKGASGSEVGGIESMQTQLNASSCQLDGETSHVKGTSGSEVVKVECMQTQLNASSHQRDESANHDVGDLIPMTNAPPSVSSDAVLPDSAAVSESNHTCEENNSQGGS